MEICWDLPVFQPGVYRQSSVFLCGTRACVLRGRAGTCGQDEKPGTGWCLRERTSVAIDFTWSQQVMFVKFADTNTCLPFLFTLLAGQLFYFSSQVFANCILILSDFSRKGTQPAEGNGRILSSFTLSKKCKERKARVVSLKHSYWCLLLQVSEGFGSVFYSREP